MAAFRTGYLGAAVFALVAAVGSLIVMLVQFPPYPDTPLLGWVWFVSRASIAAGISAALSFGLLNWMGWRLRRGPLLVRALILGTATVVGSHLLVGSLHGLLVLAESAITTELIFSFGLATIGQWIGVTVYSVLLGVFYTVPLGIAAAVLVEILERRREATEAKAAS